MKKWTFKEKMVAKYKFIRVINRLYNQWRCPHKFIPYHSETVQGGERHVLGIRVCAFSDCQKTEIIAWGYVSTHTADIL